MEPETTRNTRTIGRNALFRREVRNRDRKCVISGTMNTEGNIRANRWSSFEACHIFPLQYGSLWDQLELGKYVTDIEDTSRRAEINSS